MTLVTAEDEQDVTLRSKAEVARAILDRVEALRTLRPGRAGAQAKGGH